MPLIYTRHDPRFFDCRLHKGGDGGAGQMRADEEARQKKVQQAVDAINAKFGIAPSGPAAPAPTREQFTTRRTQGNAGPVLMDEGGIIPQGGYAGPGAVDEVFDADGFAREMAAFQGAQTDLSGAKGQRDALYADLSGAVKDTAMRDVDRQFTKASRQNTFGLARAGLLGGSVDAEAGGELATLYGEGKLKAAQAGMSAASDLRATDEKTRQNLISLAQSGLDVGTASSLAAGQMGAAADVAKSNANAASVGQLFDGMSQAYLTNQMLKARQAGATAPGATTNYGAGAAVGAGKGYTGIAGR